MRTISIAMMALAIISLSGCYDQSAYDSALQADEKRREAAWAEADLAQAEETERREKAWADSEALLEKEKDHLRRWDVLLTKQEEQARRFDAILDKWEAMPPSAGK